MPETDKEKRVSKRSEGCQFSPWASGTARTAARVTPGAGAPGHFRWSGAVRHHARDAFEAVPAMHVYFAARVRPVTAAYSSEARHMKLLGSMLMSRWMPAVLVLAFVALLAVISIALPANNDEGVWLYIGKMWVQEGLLPYVDALENKTPGIYYIYALASLFPGVGYFAGRVIALAVSAASALLVVRGLSRYHSRSAGVLGATCFSLAFCWQYMQGVLVNVTETYLVFFVFVSWYCLLRAWERYRQTGSVVPWLICAGMAMAAAVNFKQVALTSWAAMGAALVLYGAARRDWLALFFALFAYGAGTFLGFAGFTLPLLLSGVSLEAYWEGAWLILVQPGTATDAALTHRLYLALVKWTLPEMRLFLPFILYLLYVSVRDRETRLLAVVFLIWLAFDFVGVNGSGRYFGHHFKQILPSLCILAGYASGEFIRRQFPDEAGRRHGLAVLFVLIVALFFPANALLNGTGHLAFGETDPALETGLWVREHSSEGDYVQLAGGPIAQVLPYTGRRAPGRYFHHSLFPLPDARDGFLRDVEARPPRYVLFQDESDLEAYPWLQAWVREHYRPAHENAGIRVYERSAGAATPGS